MKKIIVLILICSVSFASYPHAKPGWKYLHDVWVEKYNKKQREKELRENLFAYIFGPIIGGTIIYMITSSIENKKRIDRMK